MNTDWASDSMGSFAPFPHYLYTCLAKCLIKFLLLPHFLKHGCNRSTNQIYTLQDRSLFSECRKSRKVQSKSCFSFTLRRCKVFVSYVQNSWRIKRMGKKAFLAFSLFESHANLTQCMCRENFNTSFILLIPNQKVS